MHILLVGLSWLKRERYEDTHVRPALRAKVRATDSQLEH